MILNDYINMLYQNALYDFNQHVEMLYIQAKSHISEESVKEINEKLIETYLKKQGYTMNYLLGKSIMVKGFTCVFVNKNTVEVWHDTPTKNKSVFVNESLLTGLPITLKYMEKI